MTDSNYKWLSGEQLNIYTQREYHSLLHSYFPQVKFKDTPTRDVFFKLVKICMTGLFSKIIRLWDRCGISRRDRQIMLQHQPHVQKDRFSAAVNPPPPHEHKQGIRQTHIRCADEDLTAQDPESSAAVTSCCRRLMHGPIPLLFMHTQQTCHLGNIFGMHEIDMHDSIFQSLQIH